MTTGRTDRQTRRGPTRVYRAYCPCCGLQHGHRRKIGERRRMHWSFTRDPAKPFGIVLGTTGYKSTQVLGHFDPKDDPEGFFPFVKYHLLSAIAEWIQKGWLTKAEVTRAVAGNVSAP